MQVLPFKEPGQGRPGRCRSHCSCCCRSRAACSLPRRCARRARSRLPARQTNVSRTGPNSPDTPATSMGLASRFSRAAPLRSSRIPRLARCATHAPAAHIANARRRSHDPQVTHISSSMARAGLSSRCPLRCVLRLGALANYLGLRQVRPACASSRFPRLVRCAALAPAARIANARHRSHDAQARHTCDCALSSSGRPRDDALFFMAASLLLSGGRFRLLFPSSGPLSAPSATSAAIITSVTSLLAPLALSSTLPFPLGLQSVPQASFAASPLPLSALAASAASPSTLAASAASPSTLAAPAASPSAQVQFIIV